jgi:hypothetical protein
MVGGGGQGLVQAPGMQADVNIHASQILEKCHLPITALPLDPNRHNWNADIGIGGRVRSRLQRPKTGALTENAQHMRP